MGRTGERIWKFCSRGARAARYWQRDPRKWRHRKVLHLRTICAQWRYRDHTFRRLARISRQSIVASECIIMISLTVAVLPPESSLRRVNLGPVATLRNLAETLLRIPSILLAMAAFLLSETHRAKPAF